MKTKVVYVVTSNENDLYLYQTFLSIYSLRLKNPETIVELVVDSKTDAFIKGNRAAILDLVNNKLVIDVPDTYNKVQTSRFMKTNLRNYVKGDYLFVDSDTIITDSINDIDNFEGDIGAVLDTHQSLDSYHDKECIKERIRKAGWSGPFDLGYFNSGIMFVRDNHLTREFYKVWHEKWKTTLNHAKLHYDQPPLYATNAELHSVIKELPGEWNCQVMNNGITFLYKAKIIHYLANHAISRRHADKAYLFHDNMIFESIKQTGTITPQIASMVENAKGAFVTPCVIVVGNELELLRNGLYQLSMSLPKVYAFFDLLARIIHNTGWGITKFYRKHVKKETY